MHHIATHYIGFVYIDVHTTKQMAITEMAWLPFQKLLIDFYPFSYSVAVLQKRLVIKPNNKFLFCKSTGRGTVTEVSHFKRIFVTLLQIKNQEENIV